MKPANIIFDLLRTYPDKAASVRTIMSTGSMFGFNDNQMRVSLSRLVARNSLENFKRGHYRMTDATDPVNDYVEQWRLGEKRIRPWENNKWLCVHLTTTPIATDKAHWALCITGFRAMTDKLWIRPANLAKANDVVEAEIRALGIPEASVFISDASLSPAALPTWLDYFNREKLSDRYQKMQSTLSSSMDTLSDLSLNEAKRESFHLGGEAIQMLIKDPLIPVQYQNPTRRKLLWQAIIDYDQAGREIWALGVRAQHKTQSTPKTTDIPLSTPTPTLRIRP